MTRFLMPMSKAIELVTYALKHGSNGDIFIQKTPATSINIIVKALLKIFNKKGNYKINIIGNRHGEKDKIHMTELAYMQPHEIYNLHL